MEEVSEKISKKEYIDPEDDLSPIVSFKVGADVLKLLDKYPPAELVEYGIEKKYYLFADGTIVANYLPIGYLVIIKKRLDDGMTWEEAVKDVVLTEYDEILYHRKRAIERAIKRIDEKYGKIDTKKEFMKGALLFFGELLPATLLSWQIGDIAGIATYHDPNLLQPVYEHYLREVYIPQLAAEKTARVAAAGASLISWFTIVFGLDKLYKKILGISLLSKDESED